MQSVSVYVTMHSKIVVLFVGRVARPSLRCVSCNALFLKFSFFFPCWSPMLLPGPSMCLWVVWSPTTFARASWQTAGEPCTPANASSVLQVQFMADSNDPNSTNNSNNKCRHVATVWCSHNDCKRSHVDATHLPPVPPPSTP